VPFGSVGLVVGATIGAGAITAGIALDQVNGPFLAPGFGAQGAGPDDLRAVFGTATDRVLVASSRGILRHGPAITALRHAITDTRDAIKTH
jgi:orotidine-5'-phosphate decarboxylase